MLEINEVGEMYTLLKTVNEKNLEKEVFMLKSEVSRLRDELSSIASYREKCWEYDDAMGHPRRYFSDEEEWDMMEKHAARILNETGKGSNK